VQFVAQRWSSRSASSKLPFISSSEWLGLKMKQAFKGWICLGMLAGMLVGGLPAQASEVVKLARLVVSGKRSTGETPRAAPSESRSNGSGATQGINGGGSDEAGTAPTPQRGVS
jgi:hypothetical protein